MSEVTENEEQPKFTALNHDGLRLHRLFMSIESQFARDQVIQMVEAFVKRLEKDGLKDKR